MLGTKVKSNKKKSMRALKDYLEVCDSLVVMLQKMRKVGQPLSMGIVQPIIHGMIESTALIILQESPRRFTITKKQTHQFIKQYLTRSFKLATTIASKLPSNRFKQICNTTYQIAYLVKVYNIPSTLVVNNDQTYFHLGRLSILKH